MFIGSKVFSYDNGELTLNFNPKLPGWMFDEQGEASFTFLSDCTVTYYNPSKKNTYGTDSGTITGFELDGGDKIWGSVLSGEAAARVRSGNIKNIKVYMN